jgi:ABC-2 type transport system permease protein
MTATLELTRTEGKLFLRDPIALFFGLIFPTVVLVALGLFFPGFDEPLAELGGARYIDIYAPIALGLGLATLGFVTLPPVLGAYRQFGILRRLRTTPIHPAKLLTAQLMVHGSVAVVSALGALVAAEVLFDVPFPTSGWFYLSFVLATAAIFAIGLLVGALVRSSNAGQAIGMGIYFPMLFFAGVWIPRQIMSEGLLRFSDLTPLGAAVQALGDAWSGITPSVLHLIVMTGYAVVAGALAVRFFRWE